MASFQELVDKLANSEIPSKSVMVDGVLKKDSLPSYFSKKRHVKRQRKEERDKTKGKSWFDLPRPELTEERKNDLTVLQMRSALDPKRFYKKNESTVLPKYFQVGTIVESAADFYSARIPKKERKRTLVEELLADTNFKKVKTKFQEEHPNKVSRKPSKKGSWRRGDKSKKKKKK